METWAQIQVFAWMIVLMQGIFIYVLFERVRSLSSLIERPIDSIIPKLKLTARDGESLLLGDLMKSTPQQENYLFCYVNINCKHCRELIPILQPYISLQRTKIILLGVGDKSKLQGFVTATGPQFTLYAVRIKDILETLKIKSFPYGILVDNKGVVIKRGIVKKDELDSWIGREDAIEPSSRQASG